MLLDDRELPDEIRTATTLVATVVGQDIEVCEDGVFRILRGTAKGRVISIVDPEARHGHKTAARGFDGYKGHVAIDPDSEIITATEVTAGNAGDAKAAEVLLADVLPPNEAEASLVPQKTETSAATATDSEPLKVYGDASYGTAELVERLDSSDIEANVKVQPPSAREGMFSQDEFRIDKPNATVTCPQGIVVQLRFNKEGAGHAEFGASCKVCPLKSQCTTAKNGRTVHVHPKHEVLDQARTRQRNPAWKRDYRKTRPKVERKIAHLMRRKRGGRRARMRGTLRVRHDFALLAASVNLTRIANLRGRDTLAPLAN
jgi:hypothetical protein